MTFRWTRDGRAVVSVCQLCGLANRSLSESAIYLTQRAHSWQECQEMRTRPEPVDETDVERCPEGHDRAGNTSTDKSGYIRCLACRREDYAARRQEKEAS